MANQQRRKNEPKFEKYYWHRPPVKELLYTLILKIILWDTWRRFSSIPKSILLSITKSSAHSLHVIWGQLPDAPKSETYERSGKAGWKSCIQILSAFTLMLKFKINKVSTQTKILAIQKSFLSSPTNFLIELLVTTWNSEFPEVAQKSKHVKYYFTTNLRDYSRTRPVTGHDEPPMPMDVGHLIGNMKRQAKLCLWFVRLFRSRCSILDLEYMQNHRYLLWRFIIGFGW